MNKIKTKLVFGLILLAATSSGCIKVAYNVKPEQDDDSPAAEPAEPETYSEATSAAVEDDAEGKELTEQDRAELSALIAERTREFVLVAVGDIMLTGGKSEARYRQIGHGAAFDNVRDILTAGDVTFGNLEGPITRRGDAAEDKKYTYRMAPPAMKAVAEAGFDLVSLANNHMLDFGPEGLEDTIAQLKENNVSGAGAGRNLAEARTPAIIEAAGRKVGLLAYSLTYPEEFWSSGDNPGTVFGHEKWVRADVAALREQADIVLASFHWGAELKEEPKDYQNNLGKAAIDAGADVVLGHHPHIPQGIEIYHGRPIFYSLGNFAFGTYSTSTPLSFIARIIFVAGAPTEIEIIPLNTNNFEVELQPTPMTGQKAQKTLEYLQGLSRPLGTEIKIEGDRGFIEISDPPPADRTTPAEEK